MVSAMLTYVVSMAVSFFLSPYIVENIGVEANGFIGLANSFITYASLLTVALNSMAGRFITICYQRKEYEKANIYYNSVFYANLLIAGLLLIVSIPVVLFLEKLVEIPTAMIWDVKILFLVLFLNFILSLFYSTFSVATFATNRLYLDSLRGIESVFIRVVVLVGCFVLFSPRVFYVGLATLLMTVYSTAFSYHYRKKLLPHIRVRRSFFRFSAVKEIVLSGLWNTVTQLGHILQSGLDVLIANLFINSTAMGVLSLSKTIPSAISGVVARMASVFAPELTLDYANDDIDGLVRRVKQSMKLMSTVVTIPVVVFMINGDQFYHLWTPSQDHRLLHILSVMALGSMIISGGINVVYKIFTVVNKLRWNSLTVLGQGVLSTLVVFILLKTTDWGLYVIALTSEVFGLIRVLGFVLPYSARCLNQKWYEFYPAALKPLIPAAIMLVLGYGIKQTLTVNSWLRYIVFCAVLAVMSLALNVLIILDKNDRVELLHVVKKLLRKAD